MRSVWHGLADWFRRRLGVRMRSAIAAALVVAVASILSGVAFIIASHLILRDNVDRSASQRAAQIAAAVGDNGSASLTAALRPSPRDRTVVQVVDPTGRVVAASAAAGTAAPMSPLRPYAGRHLREDRRLDVAHNESFQAVVWRRFAPGFASRTDKNGEP